MGQNELNLVAIMSRKRITFNIDEDLWDCYKKWPHFTKASELNEAIRRGIGLSDIGGEDVVHLWMIVADMQKSLHQVMDHLEALENSHRIILRVIAPLMETPINEEHSPDDMIGR